MTARRSGIDRRSPALGGRRATDHGTRVAYQYDGCRCRLCTRAEAEYHARYAKGLVPGWVDAGAGTRASRAPALPGEQQASRWAPADRPALRGAPADAAAHSLRPTADSPVHRTAHRGRDEPEPRGGTDGEAGRELQDARTAPPTHRRGRLLGLDDGRSIFTGPERVPALRAVD